MHAAALLILLSLTQDDKAEEFYKFDTGTTWTYTFDNNGKKGSIVLKSLGEEDGKRKVESLEFKEGKEEPKKETLYWYVEKGLLVWAEEKSSGIQPVFNPYKLGSKIGDTWTGMGSGEAPFKLTATHKGKKEVTVPAGKYENAVYIQMSSDQEEMKFSIDVYFVPKVGMVKFLITMGEEVSSLELKELKASK